MSNVMVMASEAEAEAYDAIRECSKQNGGKKMVVVRLAASNSSASFECRKPDFRCASGPTNERRQQQQRLQQPLLEASGVSLSPAVERDEEALRGEEEGATNLSASFSFNSYQDIVCNGSSSFFTGSTFAASHCKRLQPFSSVSTSSATQSLATNTSNNAGDIRRTRQTSSTKLRVHSRNGSICSQQQVISGEKVQVREKDSLANSGEEALTRWPPNKTHQQEVFGNSSSSISSKRRRRIVQFKQFNKLATSSSLGCVRVLARAKEEQDEANNMSQTMQSIQSLSMQLNRAASLNSSTSQLEEIIHPHQVVEANPLVDNNNHHHHHYHHHSAFDGGIQLNESSISSGFAQTTTTNSSIINSNNNSDKNDSAANKFSRLVGKKATRVKEILLQNLGKADKTTDELFEFYEENFYKQQSQAVKLQKEFKNYINSLRGAQEANKNLNCCIQQSTGDYQSARHDLVCENLSQLEHLNEDLMEKLRNQISNNISEYLAQFTELREKISKRRRKLIDYDSSRRVYETMLAAANKRRQQQQQQVNGNGLQQQIGARSLRSAFFLGGGTNNNNQESGDTQQSLQSATNQLISEARLLKLQEQYNYCKILYETINSELHEELPMVYEKKMKHLLMTLQNYFAIEAQFHSNAGKLYSTASDVIDELPMSYPSRQRAINQNQISANTEVANQVNEEGYEEEEGENEDEDEEDNEDQEVEYPGRGDVTTTAGGKKSCVVATSGSSTSGMGSSRGESSVESSSSSSSSNSDAEHDSSVAGSPTGDDMRPTQQQQIESLSEVANNIDNDNGNEQQQSERKDSTTIVEQIVVGDAGVGVVVTEEEAEAAAGKGSGGAVAVIPSQEQEQEEEEEAAGQQSVDCAREDGCEKKKNNDNNNSKEQASDDVKEVDVDDKIKIDQVIEGEPVIITPAKKGDDDQATLKQAAANNNNKNQSAAGGSLYKVKTSYKYLAEDVDELCFEADEIIQVVEFDETQEQEEGWLMGIREVNGQRGLFPANFTQPI